MIEGRTELSPKDGAHYCAAVDTIYKGDPFTLVIAHKGRGR